METKGLIFRGLKKGVGKMKRKMLGMFLATVLMFGTFDVTYGATIENTVTTQSTSTTIVKSGECGENVIYTLDSNGLLKISGSGNMNDYYIGNSPFYLNKDIKEIVIGDGVTSIGDCAFWGCSSLTSIEISDGVTSIGMSVFDSCSSLTSIEIPVGVTRLKDFVFYGCSSLTSIAIPAGVTSIGSSAFESCSSLTSIAILAGVTSIGESAFKDCSNLNTIYCYKNSTADKYTDYPSIAKKVYLDDATTTAFTFNSSTGTITGYSGSEKVVNIPSNIGGVYVKAIGENAFKNNTDIETVIIPEGVNSIEDFAFYKCTGLKYISIPESVTSVSEDGFYRCGALNITCKKGSTADNISLYPSGSTIVYYVENGDINGDGSIDMRDVIILMKYVTGKVSEI
jgi:hypothetical protein